jgi:hypothetical protein
MKRLTMLRFIKHALYVATFLTLGCSAEPEQPMKEPITPERVIFIETDSPQATVSQLRFGAYDMASRKLVRVPSLQDGLQTDDELGTTCTVSNEEDAGIKAAVKALQRDRRRSYGKRETPCHTIITCVALETSHEVRLYFQCGRISDGPIENLSRQLFGNSHDPNRSPYPDDLKAQLQRGYRRENEIRLCLETEVMLSDWSFNEPDAKNRLLLGQMSTYIMTLSSSAVRERRGPGILGWYHPQEQNMQPAEKESIKPVH